METKGDIREAPALGSFGVPTEALARLQADYLAGAIEVWNRVLQPEAAPKRPARPALRRQRVVGLAGQRLPRRDVPAERPHPARHGGVAAGRREDPVAGALRGAAVDRRGVAEQFPRPQPGSAEEGDRDPGREPGRRHAPPLGRPAAGSSLADRRDARSRSAATSPRPKAGWCSRTSSSSCSSTSRSRPRCTSGRC